MVREDWTGKQNFRVSFITVFLCKSFFRVIIKNSDVLSIRRLWTNMRTKFTRDDALQLIVLFQSDSNLGLSGKRSKGHERWRAITCCATLPNTIKKPELLSVSSQMAVNETLCFSFFFWAEVVYKRVYVLMHMGQHRE